MNYTNLLKKAFELNKNLKFANGPSIDCEIDVSEDVITKLDIHIMDYLYPLLEVTQPGYRGASCQIVSTHIFAFLTALGWKADIVYGDVKLQEVNIFDTSVEILTNEYKMNSIPNSPQQIHAWVTVGGNSIIDACLPHKLIKHYDAPANKIPDVFISTSTQLETIVNLTYEPMLIGTDFLAKTNPPNPIDVIAQYELLFAGVS